MSVKGQPAVTRPEASGRAGRKKAARRVLEAAAAADDDKFTPSGQTQMAQRDSRKAGQGKQGQWKDQRERENCLLAVDRNL